MQICKVGGKLDGTYLAITLGHKQTHERIHLNIGNCFIIDKTGTGNIIADLDNSMFKMNIDGTDYEALLQQSLLSSALPPSPNCQTCCCCYFE